MKPKWLAVLLGLVPEAKRAENAHPKLGRSRTDWRCEEEFYERAYREGVPAQTEQKRGAFEKMMISLAPALPETLDRLLASLDKVENMKICELGCGDGELTARLAKEGGAVSALDISRSGVKSAISRAHSCDLHGVDLLQMDACHLSFRDESFDVVVGKEVLHHLDVGMVSKEINRILKRGGKAFFVEPLAHNPISHLWRKITPTYRTADEWPLSYAEIYEMGGEFSSTRCEEFNLLPLLTSIVYLITHSARAKWKAGEILSRMEIPFFKKTRCRMLRMLCASVLIQFTKA